jgi:mannose-6-phosphate isomerase-like protein (cupin superfamily)
MQPVSKYNPLAQYKWGNACDSWALVDTQLLSVKQEQIPPQAAEEFHYHKKAQQFFYILTGVASFEINNNIYTVRRGEGFHVLPGVIHLIVNHADEPLEFILCSQPSTQNDRYNIT